VIVADFTVSIRARAEVEYTTTVQAGSAEEARAMVNSDACVSSDWNVLYIQSNTVSSPYVKEHQWDSKNPEALVMIFATAGIGCPFNDLSRSTLLHIVHEDLGVTFKPITLAELHRWSENEVWDEETKADIMSRPDYDWEKLSH
jgi:hypothetical protein